MQAPSAGPPPEERTRTSFETPPFFDARRLWILRQVLVVVGAASCALSIRSFGFEAYTIPSGSMLETLLIGDHLFVNKFAYGPRLPFTTLRVPGTREPARGDVVVFTVAHDSKGVYPADERPDLPRLEFVKRIVGLPGDGLAFRHGQFEVNGEAIEPVPLEAPFIDPEGRKLTSFEVRMAGRRFRILDDPARDDDTIGQLTVPPGRYFVLGDNRDHSYDSRKWGTVRQVDIKGPATRIYWSWNFNGGWLQLLDPALWWDLLREHTRWDRIGRAIS